MDFKRSLCAALSAALLLCGCNTSEEIGHDAAADGFTAEYNGSIVAVLHNTTSEELTVELSQATDISFSEVRSVIGNGTAVLDGGTLTLGAQTSAVLR